jgi:acyl-CoA synthetase (AMP-forming)/AMP-acid ligase II
MSIDDIGRRPGRDAANNVISFLDLHGRQAPARPALLWHPRAAVAAWLADRSSAMRHETMSYGELLARTTAVAAGLRRLGLRAGDRVFLFVPMSAELYVAMFAIERVGAVAVFLDSWARRDQLGHCIRLTEPSALVAPEAAWAYVADVPEVRGAGLRIVVGPHRGTYDASLGDLERETGDSLVEPKAADDTALITFTTGSSGVPKGANRTHRFLASQHRAIDRCIPYRATDVDLPTFPIFALNDMAGGVTTLLPAVDLARPAATDGRVLAEQIRAAGVTCATLSPSLLLAVAHAAIEVEVDGVTPLASLRRVATGGAPVSRDDVAVFRRAAPEAELHILYGSTEVEPIAHIEASEMPAETGEEGVCVGRVAQGLGHKLLRLHRGDVAFGRRGWPDLVVPRGEVGELAVSGEHVCRDYWRNDDAFRATKIVDDAGAVWHRTGDLCRFDDAGRLWLVGRLHNAILRGGRMLFPVRAEVTMRRLPFVQAAAYVGLPDPAHGERAVAAFSVRPGEPRSDFAALVRAALEAESLPVDEVVEVDEIPLDPRHHSKVEVQRLRAMLQAR